MKERNNRMKYVVKRFAIGLLLCATIVMAGCSNGENKKVVLTTGFEKNEVFRIEDISCMLPEIMVYLTNTQNQYEQVYGEQIWETGVGDVTLEDNVKDIVLAKMARIKTLNLMAKENDISLNDAEMNKVRVAADEYYESLTKTEREVLGIDRTLITSLYEECALADKVCEHILMDINPEVSDDEARSVTVEHIFMKTYMLDGSGQKVPYTDAMKQKVYMNTVTINKTVPVKAHYDVIVCGGGVAGCAAAVTAAKRGKSVLIIEKSNILGGLATLGLINLFVPMCNGRGKQIIFGLAEKWLRDSARYGYDTIADVWKNGEPLEYTEERYMQRYSPYIFALQLTEEVKDSGADLLFDCIACEPVMEGKTCKGVITESKSGTEYYSAICSLTSRVTATC